jgi:hypothetical protein
MFIVSSHPISTSKALPNARRTAHPRSLLSEKRASGKALTFLPGAGRTQRRGANVDSVKSLKGRERYMRRESATKDSLGNVYKLSNTISCLWRISFARLVQVYELLEPVWLGE